MSAETQQRPSAYWCHICSAEVPIYMAPDPTCQRCNEQFIEELHSDDDPREFLNDGENNDTNEDHVHQHFFRPEGTQYFTFSSRTREHSPGEMEEEDIFRYFSPGVGQNNSSNNNNRNNTHNDEDEWVDDEDNNGNRRTNSERMPPNPQFTNLLQNFITNFVGENVATRGSAEQPYIFVGDLDNSSFRLRNNNNTTTRSSQRTQTGENNNNTEANNGDENTSTNDNNNNNEPGGNTPGEGNRLNSLNSFLQYITALTGGSFDGGMVGNPNDYVFSQGALDNIITQLMEQTSGASAPAPASEQVIDSLKQRPLNNEEAVQEADCAVCKDTFVPEERVTELPCEHIFHDDCIRPWLKLNGTCPVCRHSVAPEEKQEDKSGNENINNNNNSSATRPSPNPMAWFMENTIGGTMGGRPDVMAGSWPSSTSSGSQRRNRGSNSNNNNRSRNNNQNDDAMDIDLD